MDHLYSAVFMGKSTQGRLMAIAKTFTINTLFEFIADFKPNRIFIRTD